MDTSSPPPSSLTSRRPTDFRVCYDDDNGSGDQSGSTADALRQPWGVAPIDFNYSIKTDILLESPTDEAKDAILKGVSVAIIESIYDYGCVPQQNRKRRRQSVVSFGSSASISRRAEILSISPGIGHEWLGDCDDLSSGGNNGDVTELFCSKIRGTVVIAFDRKNHPNSTVSDASDFESVGNLVLSRIEEDMANGIYADKVNNDIERFGVVINSMKYIDSDYLDLVSQDAFNPLDWSNSIEVHSVGMTRFSKVAIPIMVILSLIAMALCWCAVFSYPVDSFFAKMRRSKKERRREEDRKRKRQKESKHALSLEATLQDLTNTEIKQYWDQNPAHSKNSGNQRGSLTLPMRNNQSMRGISRFLPTSEIPSPQSTMHIADGTFHPSDTETGSTGRSVEDNPPIRRRMDGSFSANARSNSTPIRTISSFFGKNDAAEVLPDPTLMDRIRSCTGIPNNDCFGDDPRNKNDNNGTVMRYVMPSVERSNSLIEESKPPTPNISRDRTSPNMARSPMPAMGTKKSAAYRKYIDKKIRHQNAECDRLDGQIMPMEIGVKRTFTDGQGRIREMVAL